MSWNVNREKCITCGGCVGVCPTAALELSNNHGLECDAKLCNSCGICERFCPVGAIKVDKSSSIKGGVSP